MPIDEIERMQMENQEAQEAISEVSNALAANMSSVELQEADDYYDAMLAELMGTADGNVAPEAVEPQLEEENPDLGASLAAAFA
jgi:hypothetical protein